MLLNTRNGIYLQGLYYCSILSGVIRGALEIVNNTNIFCWMTLTLSSYFYIFFFLRHIMITDILSHEHDSKNQLLFLFVCFTCKTTLINSHKLESRVDWLIPEHQEVRDLKKFFHLWSKKFKEPLWSSFSWDKSLVKYCHENLPLGSTSFVQSRNFFRLTMCSCARYKCLSFFWCMTVWHNVIKKQTCEKFMGSLFHFFWFGGC